MTNRMIEVQVQMSRTDAAQVKADVLAVGVFEEGCCCAASAGVNKRLGDPLSRLKGLGDFEGKAQTTALVYGDGKVGALRVLFVGLGHGGNATGRYCSRRRRGPRRRRFR